MSETAVRIETIAQRTTLRSNNNEEEELQKEVALKQAEETLMNEEEEDEEILSCDESGTPIVDTVKLERRMMTVALVKSVVETSGDGGTTTTAAAVGDAQQQAKPHSYGLRKRNSKGRNDSSDEEEEDARPARRARKTQPLKKRSVSRSTHQRAENGPMSQQQQSTQQQRVPNPLLNNHKNAPGKIRPDGAPSAPIVMKPIEPGKRGRIFSIDIDPEGLEFPDMNIDVSMQPIPPGGAVGARIRSTSMEQGSQADSSSKSASVTFKDAQQQQHKDSLDVSLPSQTRGRAMSFEFFSFGINADEPLPPAPVLSGTEQVAPAFQRPRGDSIIFEPDSFRDGGVLEEKSRTASIDLAPEEVAIMNTPGFAPAPPTIGTDLAASTGATAVYAKQGTKTSARKSHASSHSTSRSSVTNKTNVATTSNASSLAYLSTVETPSHTSFEMELLNKDGRIGIYLPEARKARIAKFHSKRKMRIWRKRIKYDCRKKLADSRPRIKGRFVKRSDMDE